MRGVGVVFVSFGVLLAGCLGPEPVPVEPTPTDETPSLVLAGITFDVPNMTRVGNGSWGTLSFAAQGEPRTWLIGYQAFAPVDSVTYSVRYAVMTSSGSGTPLVLFFVPPHLTADRGRGIELGPFAEPELRVDEDGGEITLNDERRIGAGIGGGVWTGFFFAIGSSAAWTASVEVQLDEGGNATTAPSFLSGGRNATFVSHGSHSGGVNGPAGMVTLESQVPREGWSHLQVLFSTLQPIGVRKYDVRFPSGYAYDGFGYGYGVYTSVTGGFSSRSGKIDYVGTTQDRAGSLRAEVDYAEAVLSLDLAAVHLPAKKSEFPPDFRLGGYAGFSWPFLQVDPVRVAWDDGDQAWLQLVAEERPVA